MPGTQVEQLINQIIKALPRTKDLDAAVAEVQRELNLLMPGLADRLEADFAEARAQVAKQFEAIEILHTHSVIRRRTKWYFGPRPTDTHWSALSAYFVGAKGWHTEDVTAIDQASNEVVSLLENPDQLKFSCRGLVVGYVQSGKTANMAAVIAKGLDAGYNTIIVLAGLTNKLRYQTQLRLFEDLVQRNPLDWQVLTPNDENRDFRAPPQGGFLSHTDKAQLAVIKKNVSPLNELIKAIQHTIPAALSRLRILVIDDECDQASVNSARGELDMTAINQRIRQIVSMLPAVTYIGYTATPFANVLINPYRGSGSELDDLYPRDFITSLPRPDRYFGTERLFGRTPADPADVKPEEEGLDMIRTIPEEEETALQPKNRKDRDSFNPAMPPSLEKAVLYFIACCAARRARGDSSQHMTMLVHTSAYVQVHQKVAALIEGWCDVNSREIAKRSSKLGTQLAQIWASEQGRLPSDITEAKPVSIDEVFLRIPDVLRNLQFPIENGASDDRIDYRSDPRTYIVVGGSILARGLTLEGLMVSYFLRSASQYDTLLQMGRWFGYRPNYEDLPRIWMTDNLRCRFRALASVEQEIRDDIDQYRLRELTPMEVAVRIRSIPGMAITGANKMRAARQCAVSFWGTHRQTVRFKLDKAVLEKNWNAGAALISLSDTLGRRDPNPTSKLWRGVPKSSILRFFESYKVDLTHSDLGPSVLIPFLSSSDARLAMWNVGIVEARDGAPSVSELGPAGVVKLVNRARLIGASDSADIKALMSKGDVRFDAQQDIDASLSWDDMKAARLAAVGQVPLLLLYAIDRKSTPQRASKERAPLDAPVDVLAFGVIFPGDITEGGNFVSIDLATLSADEIEEIADEQRAQAEAAGVV